LKLIHFISFIYVDVGTNGKISDATIWENSKLKESLLKNSLNIPSPTFLPETNVKIPYHIIGDDIFPLTNYMMKPYPRQKI
jgi:DDE superfamily endonuclease